MKVVLFACCLLLLSATPALANGPVPTERDCTAMAYSHPARTARLLFLPQSAVQTCMHYGWRDGNTGLLCYDFILNWQFTENWVYTQRDIEARYNDCVALWYVFIRSSAQQYPVDLSTTDSPGQYFDPNTRTFSIVRTRPNPYHFVQAVVTLP